MCRAGQKRVLTLLAVCVPEVSLPAAPYTGADGVCGSSPPYNVPSGWVEKEELRRQCKTTPHVR